MNKYFTRQIDKFYVTFARTTLKAKCVSIYSVKLWNSLDVNLRKCSLYRSFKTNIKRNFISKYVEKLNYLLKVMHSI